MEVTQTVDLNVPRGNNLRNFNQVNGQLEGPSGRAASGVGLRPHACWDCGYESHRWHGCVSSECGVLSGRGLCDELIIHPEESYRLWCVVVCDLENSRMRRTWHTWGCRAKNVNGRHAVSPPLSIHCFRNILFKNSRTAIVKFSGVPSRKVAWGGVIVKALHY